MAEHSMLPFRRCTMKRGRRLGLARGPTRVRAAQAARRLPGRRLTFESLEQRTVLSSLSIGSVDPLANSHTAPTTTEIYATFDENIEAASISDHSFAVNPHASRSPVLLKDINVGGPTSHAFPGGFVDVGGFTFFAAGEGTHGYELWKTDGTEAGTIMVKDIWPGIGSSAPQVLTPMNGTLYFAAYNGPQGYELWKSDGTPGGTEMVKDIFPGLGGSAPDFMTVLGGTLYFSADDGINGRELWKSDGTQSGTEMVKDVWLGSDGSTPRGLAAMDGTLYFAAYNGPQGYELWKSDGTPGGTEMVKDIFPDLGGSKPDFITALGGTLYFTADDGINGRELWKSDGTEAGTVMVKDISAPGGSTPGLLTAVGETLYFTAAEGTHGYELWKSDGTEAGTIMVKDIWPDFRDSMPAELAAAGGTLYFTADDGINGREPWVLTDVMRDGSTIAFHGTDSDDSFVFTVEENLYVVVINGAVHEFPADEIDGILFDGAAGKDEAFIHDSPNNDSFVGYLEDRKLIAHGITFSFVNCEEVTAYAKAGGEDIIELYDTSGDDLFVSTAIYGGLWSDGFKVHSQGFDKVHAFALSGGYDMAKMFDSPDDDHFRANSTEAVLSGDDYDCQAERFEAVHAYATNGGVDLAEFFDSPGDEIYWGRDIDGGIIGETFFARAKHFENMHAYADAGGFDVAKLFDGPGDDLFEANPTDSRLTYGSSGHGVLKHHVHRFDQAHAYGTSGGQDTAMLDGSAENDCFYFDPPWGAALFNPDVYLNRAKFFEQVYADAGEGHDTALLRGSDGDDAFVGTPEFFELSNQLYHLYGGGSSEDEFYIRGEHFEEVAVFAGEREGDEDEANLYGLAETERWPEGGEFVGRDGSVRYWLYEFESIHLNPISSLGSQVQRPTDIKNVATLDLIFGSDGLW